MIGPSPFPQASGTGVLYFCNGILRGNVIYFFFSLWLIGSLI